MVPDDKFKSQLSSSVIEILNMYAQPGYNFISQYSVAIPAYSTITFSELKDSSMKLTASSGGNFYVEKSIPDINAAAGSEKPNINEKITMLKSSQSNAAIDISPQNLTSWKSRTRMFYALSQLDETYINNTLKSIAVAKSLAPTDAKIAYNLGLIYNAINDTDEAIKTLEQTMILKPNYRDAAYALALFYEEAKQEDAARKWYQYILTNINPNDEEAQRKVKR